MNKKWEQFKDAGLLWWINMILHTFGWAIIYKYDNDNNIIEVYPSRVKFRGFEEKTNEEGYIKISKFINDNANDLLKECES